MISTRYALLALLGACDLWLPSQVLDADGDGYDVGVDCDDRDPSAHPGAIERCNGTDDDCDGLTDEADAMDAAPSYRDADGDGFGDVADALVQCVPPEGYVAVAGDCDDELDQINPASEELCGDGLDNDCDGQSGAGCGARLEDADLQQAPLILLGELDGDMAGTKVAVAGDHDGDGYDDLAVASYHCPQGDGHGCVYVVSGQTRGRLTLTASWAVIEGEEPGDHAGFTLQGGGDADGDGWQDLLLGAPFSDRGAEGGGAAYLVAGPLSGSRSLAQASAAWHGEDEGDYAAWSLAFAGDMDSDGRAELLVGTSCSDYHRSGGNSVACLLEAAEGELPLEESALARFYAEQEGDCAGNSLAAGEDIDGDGVPDMLLGAPWADVPEESDGAAYLVKGPRQGDLCLEQADACYRGSDGERLGRAVANAGDVDADGYEDILVGTYSADHNGSSSGAAYLVLGGPLQGDGQESIIEAAEALLAGSFSYSWVGGALAGAGDVDGDGWDDLLVSESNIYQGEGGVFLVYGPVTGQHEIRDVAVRFSGVHLEGVLEPPSSLAGGAYLDDDPYADLLVGDPAAEGGFAYVLTGGAGL